MKNLMRGLFATVLALTIAITGVSVVLADDEGRTLQLGDLEKAGLVVPEITIAIQGDSLDFYPLRVGRTNILNTGYIVGQHSSDSDIQEEEIRVDGAIKTWGYAWADTTDDWETNNYLAACQTSMSNPPGLQYFWAESLHYFYTYLYGQGQGLSSNDYQE